MSVRDDEVDRINRILSGADFGNLPSEDERPDIWIVAVIVCPGDDLDPVIDWAKELGDEDIDRVQFYYHSDVDIETVTTPWMEAGFPAPITHEVQDFTTFHKTFGWEFNDQVYRALAGSLPDPHLFASQQEASHRHRAPGRGGRQRFVAQDP